jgi:hypothetical protein
MPQLSFPHLQVKKEFYSRAAEKLIKKMFDLHLEIPQRFDLIWRSVEWTKRLGVSCSNNAKNCKTCVVCWANNKKTSSDELNKFEFLCDFHVPSSLTLVRITKLVTV